MSLLHFILRRVVSVGFTGVLAGVVLCGFSQAEGPLLLRNPSLSKDKIAFLYADDIWTVGREGGWRGDGRAVLFPGRDGDCVLDA
jgi:hypothetical protein